MPCTVTAFSVKIATPGNTAMEMVIAREVICDWNERHALEQKRVLLPLCCCAAKNADAPSDLLIAFFCNSAAGLDEPEADSAEEEIENQLRAGKPALIYFSDARVDLRKSHVLLQSGTADEFKKRYMMATVDSYGDDKELRAKFARHLDVTIATHDHFRMKPAGSEEAAAPKPLDPRRTGPLSPWAQTILIEACDDFEAYIGRIKAGNMLRIQANGKQLVDGDSAETIAKWDAAFNELLEGEYIRDAGCNGQLFQISTKGFEFLKTIGKTPVGYIAEMGGM